LIIEGRGAWSDPAAVAVADGEMVGKPAIHGLRDAAPGHTEAAGRTSKASLAGRVAVSLGEAGQAVAKDVQWLAASRGEPVGPGNADGFSDGQRAAQLFGPEMVRVGESVEVGLHGFGAKRSDCSG
jgi:hypothetical protein